MCTGVTAICVCNHYFPLRISTPCPHRPSGSCAYPYPRFQRVTFQCGQCDLADQSLLLLSISKSSMLQEAQKSHSEAWEDYVSDANRRKERLWQAWYAGELTREERQQREWDVNELVGREKRRLVEELEKREMDIEKYVTEEVERCREKWERKTKEFVAREEDRISWLGVEDDG